MICYIRIKDDKPFEHPITEENFIQSFPHIDVNNLPPEFARFNRTTFEESGLSLPIPEGKIADVVGYHLAEDGVTWQDEWAYIDTPQHIIEEREAVKLQITLKVAKDILENRKQEGRKILESLTDESEKVAWIQYFKLMDPIQVTDAHDIAIPKIPIKNQEGKYIPNLDENGNWVTRILIHDGNFTYN